MNGRPGLLRRADNSGLPGLIARLVLAVMFIYTGFNKAVAPYEFLKMLNQYALFSHDHYKWMNAVAITLPWLEVFCGVLLLGGIAVRGTALVLVGMLVPFTIVVTLRALHVQKVEQIAFCAIKFDCGCGTGAINICRKLVENSVLMLLSLMLLWSKTTVAFANLWSPRKVGLARPTQTPPDAPSERR